MVPKKIKRAYLLVTKLLLLVNFSSFSQPRELGLFEGRSDIGVASAGGSAVYNSETDEYIMSTAIENREENKQSVNFLWKRMKGDFIVYAQTRIVSQQSNKHDKIGWMVCPSLKEGFPGVFAFVNGESEACLQVKSKPTDTTTDILTKPVEADVVQLEREGNTYTMRVAKFGEPFVVQQITDLALSDDVYICLFISSDNKDVPIKGICSNIRISIPVPKVLALYRKDVGSNVEVLDVKTGRREVIYSDSNSVHSPVWGKDGKTVIFGKHGSLYTLSPQGHILRKLFTGELKSNDNDHVLSFDGKMISFCIQTKENGGPIIYTVPAEGGKPKRINRKGPSFPHSWSPDGKALLFSGSRKGEYEIYKVSAKGGKENAITNISGMDDSPEYTPDGKYIYFNSNRTGNMRIWRMKPDGSDQEAMTTGEFYDWFPHISPDGKWVAFLSYPTDEASASGHPSYRHIYIRLMPVSGGQPKVVAYVYGGQGTMNSPCWSPDSQRIAFASYTDTQY